MKPSRLFFVAAVLLAAVGTGYFFAGTQTNEIAQFGSDRAAQNSSSAQPAAQQAQPSLTPVPVAAAPQPVVAPLFIIDSWIVAKPDTRPLAPEEPAASRMVRATAQVRRGSLPSLFQLKPGDRVALPLRGGQTVQGVVNLVQPDAEGWVRVGGGLNDGADGSFSLSQRGKEWAGMVRMPKSETAYVLHTDAAGIVQVQEKPLSSVMCRAMAKKRPPGTGAQANSGAAPATVAAAPVVPALDSLPAASAVFYLDFDGEVVTDPDWNNGFTVSAQPAKLGGVVISAAQMTDVWKRVAEDYKPFNISVTTIRSRYDDAAVGHRMRCVVTSTDYWEPSAGGIAYLQSFDQAGTFFSSTVPCWAFVGDSYNTADISGTISHEGGHTFGLSHDSVVDAGTNIVKDEYSSGHGKWAPIMGVTYDRTITQWSICEYTDGWNHEDNQDGSIKRLFKEDDVAIISNAANGFGYQTDEDQAGNVVLPNTGVFNTTGVIASQADVDTFVFSTNGGSATITVNPAAVEPNLDVRLDLYDATNTNIGSSFSTTAMNATITKTLTAGTYHFSIRGSGLGLPDTTGYSIYGSIGAYTITGTFAAVPDAAPTIAVDPLPQTLPVGSKVTFSVTAVSNIPMTYQWQKDNVDITGAKAASYVIASAQPSHQGAYRCLVSNSIGATPSNAATLALNFKPAITVQPLKTTVGVGSGLPLTMSLTAIGTPTITYQWQKNSVNLPSQTSATLSISNPQLGDAGAYRCIVSNAFGSVTSAAVVATVTSAPMITVPPPATKGVPRGGVATISLTAVGTPTLTYQWYKGTAKVAGATKALLTLAAITDATAGTYHCEIKNTVAGLINTTVSTDCIVTVGLAPAVTTHPVAPLPLAIGAPLHLACVATGDPTLTYQWQRDNVDIPLATGAAYDVAGVTWNDRGTYRVVVSNFFGSIISKTALVTVKSPPIVVTNPLPTKVAKGAKKVLTVVASGSPTLKYQWRKDTVNVPGGVAASLTVTGVATASYDVVITNLYGTATTTPVTLTVEDAPKIAVLPASSLAALGGVFNLQANVTGTAPFTYVWKKNGVVLPSQVSSQLQLSGLVATDAASYTVTVTNDVGTTTSTVSKLVVLDPPHITQPPVSITANAYENMSFTVVATGSPTLTYQWRKGTADITGAITNKLILNGVQAVNQDVYSCRVSNSVGSETSVPVMLTVTPVASPTVTGFTPHIGKVGHYVRVFGTNLNWTTAVQMTKSTGSVVSAAFVIVSPTELLVTVPAGAATSAFALTTRGGNVSTAESFQVVTTPANDLFANAQVIPGIGGKVSSTLPTTFVPETGEPAHSYPGNTDPDFDATYSAWWSFKPSVSGIYSFSTIGSVFDTRIGIYTGTAVNALTMIAGNDDQNYDGRIYTSYTVATLTAGETYFIALDGFDFSFIDSFTGETVVVNEFGNYSLTATRIAAALPPKSGVVASTQTAPVRLSLGGIGKTSPESVSLPLVADGGDCGATLSFASPAGAADQMGLTAYSAQGAALFGLSFRSDTGALSVVNSYGATTATGQTLLPDMDYSLVIKTDAPRHVWGALLNGEWICRDVPVPPNTDVHDFTAQWLPGTTGTARSNLRVRTGDQ